MNKQYLKNKVSEKYMVMTPDYSLIAKDLERGEEVLIPLEANQKNDIRNRIRVSILGYLSDEYRLQTKINNNVLKLTAVKKQA